jgi:hypothetical protein
MQLGAIEPNRPSAKSNDLGISASDIDSTALAARVEKLESDIRMYKMILLAAVVIYFLTKQK